MDTLVVKTIVTGLRFVPAKHVSDCGFFYFYWENVLNHMPRFYFNVFPRLRGKLPASCGSQSECVQNVHLPHGLLFLLSFLWLSVSKSMILVVLHIQNPEVLPGTFSVILHILLVTMSCNTSVNLSEFTSFLFVSSA